MYYHKPFLYKFKITYNTVLILLKLKMKLLIANTVYFRTNMKRRSFRPPHKIVDKTVFYYNVNAGRSLAVGFNMTCGDRSSPSWL